MLLFVLSGGVAWATSVQEAEETLKRGDSANAISMFRTLAEAGDVAAMVRLGALYQEGQGVPRDLARAVAYFTEAATHGSADAEFNLGNLYLMGEGVPQDNDWAFTYYRQAAAQGHVLAQKNVDQFYRTAGIVPPGPRPPGGDAIGAATPPNLTPTTPAGDAEPTPPSVPLVGTVPSAYSDDEWRAADAARAHGVAIDHAPDAQQALSEQTPAETVTAVPAQPTSVAASQESTPTLAELKQALAEGRVGEGKRGLERLAGKGNAEAQFLLSHVLKTTLPEDSAEALMWLKRAAKGGVAEAQYTLGETYRRGSPSTPADEAEAITWYRAAARQGHAGAQQQLEGIYREAGVPMPELMSPAPSRQ